MKKFSLLLCSLFLFYSCLNNPDPDFTYEYLPIDEAITPVSFTFGQVDTIKLKYSLPDGCHSFDDLYYESQNTTRVVAITAFVVLGRDCAQETIQEEYKFTIRATQQEDYLFKFWKGKDSQGNNIYEEVVIPVN
ncbi:MAG: hypothetical protein ACPGTO_04575 [Polaribacter sp.]